METEMVSMELPHGVPPLTTLDESYAHKSQSGESSNLGGASNFDRIKRRTPYSAHTPNDNIISVNSNWSNKYVDVDKYISYTQ